MYIAFSKKRDIYRHDENIVLAFAIFAFIFLELLERALTDISAKDAETEKEDSLQTLHGHAKMT